MPLVLLVALFIVVPIAEIYVIIQVGQAIGALPTIGLLILDSILGSWLLRSQGRAVWRRFNQALTERRVPAREVLDGAMVIFGGAFLITPGFISDVVGALLLLPPTRALVRRVFVSRMGARMAMGAAGAAGDRFESGPRGQTGPPGRDYDVDGSAVDVESRHLGR